VGAKIENDGGEGVRITFTEESLREFYRRDVLPHEIGHHVDRDGPPSEGFARWFATQYGGPPRRP
jgi:hypothetical protein